MLFIYREIKGGEDVNLKIKMESGESNESITQKKDSFVEKIRSGAKNIFGKKTLRKPKELNSEQQSLKYLIGEPYFMELDIQAQEKLLIKVMNEGIAKGFYGVVNSIAYYSNKPYAKIILMEICKRSPAYVITSANLFLDQPYAEEIIRKAAASDPISALEYCHRFIGATYAEEIIEQAANDNPSFAFLFAHKFREQPFYEKIIRQIQPKVNIKTISDFLYMAATSYHDEYNIFSSDNIFSEIDKANSSYFLKLVIDDIYEDAFQTQKKNYTDEYKKHFPELNRNNGKSYSYIPISPDMGVCYSKKGHIEKVFEFNGSGVHNEVKNNFAKILEKKIKQELFNTNSISESEIKILLNDYLATINVSIRHTIESDFNIQLEKINLRTQVQFINFIKNKTTKDIHAVQLLINQSTDETDRYNRLKAFLALENDSKIGEIILKLGKHPQADKIFARFGEIMEIFEKQEEVLRAQIKNYEKKNNIDVDRLYLAIARRGNELLKTFAAEAENHPDEISKLEGLEAYEREVITWGALFSSAAKSKGEMRSPEEMNQLIKGIKIDIQSGGHLIKASDRESMKQPENYTNPEIFNEKDYEMLVKNLKISYQYIDAGWLEHLIDNIPKDLQNPQVKFTLIRNTNNGKLVGLCKIKKDPEEENAYYFGTHYVEPEFQKTFGLGGYLQKMAESQIPKDAKIVATVATANPAMERHIDSHDGIGTAVVFEADEKNSSRELIKFAWRDPRQFETKNKSIFTREKIMAMAMGEWPDEVPKNANIYVVDTRADHQQEFLDLCQKHFAEGKVISRIFYDKTPKGRPNLEKTYVVFEKSKD